MSRVEYRYLTPADVPAMHAAFMRAFADYFVDSRMSPEDFRNHLTHNAVSLPLSVGAFAGGELVGLLLNAVDRWHGALTAYDAGTGIVPDFRGRGVAGAMFNFALPKLREQGVRQCLLEVIRENEPAIKAYRNLGFATVRLLECLKSDADPADRAINAGDRIDITPLHRPDWRRLRTFWDWHPSWQNGTKSVERSRSQITICGAFRDGSCVGYAAFAPRGGRILQLAVAPSARRRGIATRLLHAVREGVPWQTGLSMINVDGGAQATLAFLRAQGFESYITQFEMVRPLP